MAFKNSNIDWISEIPDNWNVRKLKYILNERIEKNNPIKTNNVLSLTAIQGVVPYSEKKASGGNKQKEDLSTYKLAYPNDIVLNSMNIVTGSVGLSNYYGCVSPVYYMFYTDNENINIKYYNYIFKSKIFQKRLIGFGNGILQMTSEAGNLYAVRMKIPIDKFKSLMFPVPPIEVQNAIVEYLNIKVDWINSIIRKYEDLLILLEEKRVALINQVVTKGLDHEVHLKDSGVEWIGKIPEDWEVVPFKRLFDNIKDGTHGSFQRVRNGKPLLSAKNVYNNMINISENESLISEEDYQSIISNGFPKKYDLLLTIVGSIGRSCVYDKEYPLAFQRSVSFIRLTRDNPYFYNYFVKSDLFYSQLMIKAKESAQKGVYLNDIKECLVIKPPLKKQTEIANYLHKHVSKINKTITKIKENIALLDEYKTSLIYNAVTGKFDVRSEEI